MPRKNKFEIRLTASCQKDLDRLPSDIFNKVIEKLRELETSPLPVGYKKLNQNCYRVRVGSYRIIYFLEKEKIIVARIRHRQEVYERIYHLIKHFSK